MQRQTFVEDLSNELRQWDSEIEEIESKVQRAHTGISVEYERYAKRLRDRRRLAAETLHVVQNSSDEDWSEVSDEAPEALNSMKDAFWSILSEVK